MDRAAAPLRAWAPYLPHQAWLREHGASHDDPEGASAAPMVLRGADLRSVRLGAARLSYAALHGARLSGADLTGIWLDLADLTNVDLRDVDLRGARLFGAQLEGAQLEGAQLGGADLAHARLVGADLTGADLAGAQLGGADLTHARLVRANLSAARLDGARLEGADLTGARLDGTILDPKAPVPPCTDEQLRAADLEPRRVQGRDRVYGWRTCVSLEVGHTAYSPGRWYHAHVLSVDQTTACHPGIYLGGTRFRTDYPGARLVQVWAFRSELVYVSAAKGARARRVWVLDDATGEHVPPSRRSRDG